MFSISFRPTAPTQLLACTTSSASAALLGAGGGSNVRIANTSGQRARIQFGDANVVAIKPTAATQAASGSIGLANGEVLYHRINPVTQTYFAALLDSSTGNIEITVGDLV